MKTHEIIIEIVRAGLIVGLKESSKSGATELWFHVRAYDYEPKKPYALTPEINQFGNWEWRKPQNYVPSNCVAKPRDKSGICVEVRAAGCYCYTTIEGRETEYTAKNRKEILRFVKSRAKLFAAYDLHFTGDATPETASFSNTHRGRTAKKQLEATPQPRIAPEILEIAHKIELWANKNGIDALAILNGDIPATPETIMQAVISCKPFPEAHIIETTDNTLETLKLSGNEPQEVLAVSPQDWARDYVAALIETHPNRARKLEKSLEWQLSQFGTVAPELWQKRAKMSFDAKIAQG